jgi:hypothetical protein
MSEGAELELDLEIKAFLAGLEELANVTGQEFSKLVRANGRSICVYLAYQTQPLGDDARAKSQGEQAIIRDLYRVYATPESVYDSMKKMAGHGKQTGEQIARAFYAAVANGKIERARKILHASGIQESRIDLGNWDDGKIHQRRRNARGRVSGRSPSLIVLKPEKLRAYAKKILRNVGIAKSSWADSARALGGVRGIPQWVTRHKGNGALEDQSGDFLYPHVRVISRVPWIKTVLTDRQMTEALRMQREAMGKNVRTRLEYIARKAGLKAA